jgi:succinyl-CoA synthetase beta subunit
MVWNLREELVEIDVNPIALTSDGQALALDALMTFKNLST